VLWNLSSAPILNIFGGWQDEFVKKSPQMNPNQFFQK
jgi:hypothetical protein